LRERTHNSSGHECFFLNRADRLKGQPNGEAKLQALSIPRLIDTALLILPARPRGGTAQAVPNLFRKRKSRNTLPRHSINLRRMACVSGKGRFASKGMSESLSQSQTHLFPNDAPSVDASIESRGPPNGVIPALPKRKAL